MDKLHSTMVDACDRLLLLLTGPRALTDPDAKEAALEAIELLRELEAYLQGGGDCVIEESMLDNVVRRTEVLNHVNEVFAVLREQGLYR